MMNQIPEHDDRSLSSNSFTGNQVEDYLVLLSVDDKNSVVLYKLAEAYLNRGDIDAAKQYFLKSVTYNPHDAEALNALGLCFLATDDIDEAIEYFDAALAVDAEFELAHRNKADSLMKSKRFDDAMVCLEKAIQLAPDNTALINVKGKVLLKLDRFEEATTIFKQTLEKQPDSLEILQNLAMALLGLKQYDQALESLARTLKLQPDSDCYMIQGRVYLERGESLKALNSFNRGAQLNPFHPFLFADKANCHISLKQFDLAYQSIQVAIKNALNNDGVIYHNIAHVLHKLNRFDEAFVGYDIALEFDGKNPDMLWNRSLLLILTGHYEDGWSMFEQRIHTKSLKHNYYDFGNKEWRGDVDISGKKLLIYSEQGLGDIIQFCRYVKSLKSLAAEVIFEVPAALYTVISTLDSELIIVQRGDEQPSFDYCCPVMSLPFVFKTSLDTIPAETPYLYPDNSKVAYWRDQLGSTRLPRVGIVWSGQKLHANDSNRSISLEMLLPLFSLPVEWHSLQKEYRSSDLEVLNLYSEIRQHQRQLHDFSDTAALIECMDLVISVDTSVAHLAAALNKPVWILLPLVPDYRWLLEREDSPWYPSVRLFRQTHLGEWSPVIERLKTALAEHIEESTKSGTNYIGLESAFAQARSCHIRGLQAQSSGNYSEAVSLYKQALSAQPDFLVAWRGLAQLYLATNQLLDAFDTIVPLVENYPQDLLARQLFGRLCLRLQDYAVAEDQFKFVLEELPESLSALAGLLDVYLAKNELVAAKDISLKMLSIGEKTEVALMATATLCAASGQFDEELDLLSKLVELYPENKVHRYNRSRALLRQGKFELGWDEYENRFGTIIEKSQLKSPVWQGEPVAALLILAEQGLGDTIMFSRYLEAAKAKAQTVIFACQPELMALMQESYSLHIVDVKNLPDLDVDAHCFLLSLPYILQLDKLELFQYQTCLKSQEDHLVYWRDLLNSYASQIKVGVAFASSVVHSTEFCPSFRRTCDPSDLESLNTLQNTAIFNLQIGQENPFPNHWLNAQELIRSFEDTVALIEQLDLVITVDTVIAHLVGGLNKPCVLLLPYAADWRWMTDPTITDWYPSVFLFRQDSPGDWHSAVNAAKRFIESAFKNWASTGLII